jgi:hypothetical protein
MNPAFSFNSLIASAAALQRLDGVAGVLLFKGKNTIHQQLPFSESRALDLQQTLWQMMDGYRQVERRMRQVFLEFDGGTVLLLIHSDSILVMLLTARADADLIASAGSIMLADHADLLAELSAEAEASTPNKTADGIEELTITGPAEVQAIIQKAQLPASPNQWLQVRKCIESTLGKVMGSGQASNLVERSLVEQAIIDPFRLSPEQLRECVLKIMDHIPNQAKRRQLSAELLSRMQEIPH